MFLSSLYTIIQTLVAKTGAYLILFQGVGDGRVYFNLGIKISKYITNGNSYYYSL